MSVYLILGTGHRATAYIKQIISNGYTKCILYDNDQEQLNYFCTKFGLTGPNIKMITQIEEILEIPQKKITCFICLPDYLHCEATELILMKWSKYPEFKLVIEKPLCITKEEISRMRKVIRQRKCQIYIPLVLRYTQFGKQLKSMLPQVGKVLSLSINLYLDKAHSGAYFRRWHRDSTKCGGLLLTKSIHDIDLMSWLINSKVEEITWLSSRTEFPDIEDFSEQKKCSDCIVEKCDYRYTSKKTYTFGNKVNDQCVFSPSQNQKIDDTYSVSIKFKSTSSQNVIGNLTINLGTPIANRIITIVGNQGILTGNYKESWTSFNFDKKESIDAPLVGHMGGDSAFFNEILNGQHLSHSEIETILEHTCLLTQI